MFTMKIGDLLAKFFFSIISRVRFVDCVRSINRQFTIINFLFLFVLIWFFSVLHFSLSPILWFISTFDRVHFNQFGRKWNFINKLQVIFCSNFSFSREIVRLKSIFSASIRFVGLRCDLHRKIYDDRHSFLVDVIKMNRNTRTECRLQSSEVLSSSENFVLFSSLWSLKYFSVQLHFGFGSSLFLLVVVRHSDRNKT